MCIRDRYKEGLNKSFIAASTIKKSSLIYSTLVNSTPAFPDILLPGSSIIFSSLSLNSSSINEIKFAVDGTISSIYVMPRPPPKSKNSKSIPVLLILSARLIIALAVNL